MADITVNNNTTKAHLKLCHRRILTQKSEDVTQLLTLNHAVLVEIDGFECVNDFTDLIGVQNVRHDGINCRELFYHCRVEIFGLQLVKAENDRESILLDIFVTTRVLAFFTTLLAFWAIERLSVFSHAYRRKARSEEKSEGIVSALATHQRKVSKTFKAQVERKNASTYLCNSKTFRLESNVPITLQIVLMRHDLPVDISFPASDM